MRGGHCLNVWTKKQQVVSLSSAESDLYAAVKTASEEPGIQSVAKDLGTPCGLNQHLDASAKMFTEDWAKRSTLTCRICGYQAGSSRRRSARA